MTSIPVKFSVIETILGTILLIVGYFVGPQELWGNRFLDVGIGFYVGAGFTFILGAIWGSIHHSTEI